LVKFFGVKKAEWLEHLTVNAKVATVLGSIPASSDTVESEGQQIKRCGIKYCTVQYFRNYPADAKISEAIPTYTNLPG
jgi:hypothetical protein